MTATGARLSAVDRRRQLVGIGLRLLTERPIHEITVDEVAAIAGISRGLLFHYFPAKRDFQVAVVQAAGRRLLHAMEPDPDTPASERLRATVDGYLAFVQRRREPYVTLMRGRSSGEWVQPLNDQVREELVDRILSGLGLASTPPARLVVRGWLALVEETALIWSDSPVGERSTVIDYLASALSDLLNRGLSRSDPPA